MLSPKDSETIEKKKITLNKTHAVNKWRPASTATATQFFTKTPFSQTQPCSYR